MTEVQAPEAKTLNPTQRRAVSEYERTISTLASAASTRTYLSDAPPVGVSGCYDYQQDRIILYPAIEAIDSTVVALEEAGHSQQRAEYQKHHKKTLSFAIKAAPLQARGILDWLEDWRVFTELEKQFPGAAARFRRHWELRARFMAQQLKEHPEALVSSILLGIAQRALKTKKAPKTYAAVLREANRLLSRLSQQQQQQSSDDSGDKSEGAENEDSDETSGGSADDSEDNEEAGKDGTGDDGSGDSDDTKGDSGDEGGSDSGDNGGDESEPGNEAGDSGANSGGGEGPSADAQQDAGEEAAGHEGGRSEIGKEGEDETLLPEELAPYLAGVTLLADPRESTERLHSSGSWRMNYRRVTYTGRPWKTLDSAVMEAETDA